MAAAVFDAAVASAGVDQSEVRSGVGQELVAQFCGCFRRRGEDGIGYAAAADSGAVNRVGITETDLDFLRTDPQHVGHRAGQNGSGAVADILRGSGDDKSVRAGIDLNLRFGVVEVTPQAKGGANAAAEPAGMLATARPGAPRRQLRCPIVKRLAQRFPIPPPAQFYRVYASIVSQLVDALLQRPE